MAVRWIDAIADLAIFEAADPAGASRRASELRRGRRVDRYRCGTEVLIPYAATIDGQVPRQRALGSVVQQRVSSLSPATRSRFAQGRLMHLLVIFQVRTADE